jgi:hypothetical protein
VVGSDAVVQRAQLAPAASGVEIGGRSCRSNITAGWGGYVLFIGAGVAKRRRHGRMTL